MYIYILLYICIYRHPYIIYHDLIDTKSPLILCFFFRKAEATKMKEENTQLKAADMGVSIKGDWYTHSLKGFLGWMTINHVYNDIYILNCSEILNRIVYDIHLQSISSSCCCPSTEQYPQIVSQHPWLPPGKSGGRSKVGGRCQQQSSATGKGGTLRRTFFSAMLAPHLPVVPRWRLSCKGNCRSRQRVVSGHGRKFGPLGDVPSGKRLQYYGRIHYFSWENSLFLWPFSRARLNYQRVCLMVATCLQPVWNLSQVGEVRVMEGKKACGCPGHWVEAHPAS